MNLKWGEIDFSSKMICVIQDDTIYEVNTAGQTQEIGKTEKWCKDLLDVANEYKQLCLDNGLIEEEKTPEQIQIELMQQMMMQMTSQNEVIKDLKAEMEALKNERNEPGRTSSTDAGDRRTTGTTSSKKSTAKDATNEV